MNMIKRVCKTSIQGIGIACTLFILIGIIIDCANQGIISFENWTFTRQGIGTLLIGIAFSAPSEIYRNDRFPFIFKFLFHMGIGCTVYIITAFYVGWVPLSLGWKNCFFFILLELFLAFCIWLGFAGYYWKLAKDMNKKIRQKELLSESEPEKRM